MTRAQREKRPSPGFRHAFDIDRIGTSRYTAPERGTTRLHEMRFAAVMRVLFANGVSSVLDLGCGDGELFIRLAQHPRFNRLFGIDISSESVSQARRALHFVSDARGQQIGLAVASFTSADNGLQGFECAVLLETIEHIEVHRLPSVESAVFGSYRPLNVIITTPNKEYNALHGMKPGALRHPDHRFEWDRREFQTWSRGVAAT